MPGSACRCSAASSRSITEQCVKAGLVWGEELIFDATKVRANASMDSLIPRLRLLTEEHLAQLEPPEPPTTLRRANDARWDLLEECRLDPERPPIRWLRAQERPAGEHHRPRCRR